MPLNKFILTLFLITLTSCFKSNSELKRIPIHNQVLLEIQQDKVRKVETNADIKVRSKEQSAVIVTHNKDKVKNKSFFNELFNEPNVKTEKIKIIDDSNTGEIQKLAKKYKQQAIKNKQLASENIIKKSKNNKQPEKKSEILEINPKPNNLASKILAKNSKGNLLEQAKTGYYVQVIAFKDRLKAVELVPKFIDISDVYISPRLSGDSTWYRLRVGPKANKSEAKDLQQQLANLGYDDTLIIEEK